MLRAFNIDCAQTIGYTNFEMDLGLSQMLVPDLFLLRIGHIGIFSLKIEEK